MPVTSSRETVPPGSAGTSANAGWAEAGAGRTSVTPCTSSGPTIQSTAAQTNNAVADRRRNGMASTKSTPQQIRRLSAGASPGISAPIPRPTTASSTARTASPTRSAASHRPRCGNRPPDPSASPTPASRMNSAAEACERKRCGQAGAGVTAWWPGRTCTAISPISASPRAASRPAHHAGDLRAPPVAAAGAKRSVPDVHLMTPPSSRTRPGTPRVRTRAASEVPVLRDPSGTRISAARGAPVAHTSRFREVRGPHRARQRDLRHAAVPRTASAGQVVRNRKPGVTPWSQDRPTLGA